MTATPVFGATLKEIPAPGQRVRLRARSLLVEEVAGGQP
jgi:hypothetical protein